MTEIEITEAPFLTPDQERLLDLHSVLNVINIIKIQLEILEMEHPPAEEHFVGFRRILYATAEKLHKDGDIGSILDPVLALESPIGTALQIVGKDATDPEVQTKCVETARTLDAVFHILDDRAKELKRRADVDDPWSEIPIEDVQRMFTELFDAVEKNAAGRYWICYNPARQGPQHYYIDLIFEAEEKATFHIPERLIDVLRDLTLNARKYTHPGGKIVLGVHQDGERFRCSIEDSGLGIPSEELSRVCEFGYRASNVGDVRTMGAGFGLTKAASSILGWEGRIWIASEEGTGTRIRFEIPNSL